MREKQVAQESTTNDTVWHPPYDRRPWTRWLTYEPMPPYGAS